MLPWLRRHVDSLYSLEFSMTYTTILCRIMSFSKFMVEVTGLELNVSVTVSNVHAKFEIELEL